MPNIEREEKYLNVCLPFNFYLPVTCLGLCSTSILVFVISFTGYIQFLLDYGLSLHKMGICTWCIIERNSFTYFIIFSFLKEKWSYSGQRVKTVPGFSIFMPPYRRCRRHYVFGLSVRPSGFPSVRMSVRIFSFTR